MGCEIYNLQLVDQFAAQFAGRANVTTKNISIKNPKAKVLIEWHGIVCLGFFPISLFCQLISALIGSYFPISRTILLTNYILFPLLFFVSLLFSFCFC